MENFVVVVECAIEHDGKFLMIKRPPGVHAEGLLAFPGGKVDYVDGENQRDILLHAVKREVLEEVGLTLADPIQYVTSSYFTDLKHNSVLDAIFYTKLLKTEVVVTPSKREVPEHYWMTPKEINEHADAPEWLKRYLVKATEVCG